MKIILKRKDNTISLESLRASLNFHKIVFHMGESTNVMIDDESTLTISGISYPVSCRELVSSVMVSEDRRPLLITTKKMAHKRLMSSDKEFSSRLLKALDILGVPASGFNIIGLDEYTLCIVFLQDCAKHIFTNSALTFAIKAIAETPNRVIAEEAIERLLGEYGFYDQPREAIFSKIKDIKGILPALDEEIYRSYSSNDISSPIYRIGYANLLHNAGLRSKGEYGNSETSGCYLRVIARHPGVV